MSEEAAEQTAAEPVKPRSDAYGTWAASGCEWRSAWKGESLAKHAGNVHFVECFLDEMLYDAFGHLAAWEQDGPSYTNDYYDNSIEVYAPGIEATPHALAVLAEAGFSRAWIHPHVRNDPAGNYRGCPKPECPLHMLPRKEEP